MSEPDIITMAEWQEEVARIRPDNEPGQTTRELAALFGASASYTHRIINRGIASGRYVVGTGIRIDSAGRPRRVPVYRLAKAKAK